MREINREIVSAAIFAKDGKVLLGKKSEKAGAVYSGCWAIPGGGIDEGEEPIEALKLEIMEETQIDISHSDIQMFDDSKTGTSEKTLKDTGELVLCHMHFIDYKVQINDKNSEEIIINTDREFEESGWFNSAELTNMKLTPPTIELFKMMGYLN